MSRGTIGTTLAIPALGAGGVAFPTRLAAQARVQAPHVTAAAARCTPAVGQPASAAAGRRITAVVVATAPPDRLPGGRRVPLHVTTRAETVRSRLLFAVGQPVDTARIAESLRQLQRLPYLLGARITAACDSAGGAVLTVATRDTWSIRPQLSVRGGRRATAGLEETNLFGTGRTARLYLRSDEGQLGFGGAYADPTLFGGRAVGAVRRDVFRDGRGWGAMLRTWDAGVFAPWGAGVAVQQASRASVRRTAYTAPGDTVRRATALALVSHRLTLSAQGATFLRAGVEGERTALAAGPQLLIVGPPRVRRTFAGVDLGLARRSAQYVTTNWLLPNGSEPLRLGLTRPEVPLGFEAEGLVSVGRDFTARQAATHVDLWAGRIFSPGGHAGGGPPRVLLSADVWASGYHPLRTRVTEWSGGSVRGSLGAVAPASHGLWSARLSVEHLADPDPDVRSLALIDPVQRAVPVAGRLAESALTGSLERSRHLVGITRNYVLDAALFGAGSVRWESAASQAGSSFGAVIGGHRHHVLVGAEQLYVGSVGAGFRLTPTHFGPATIRFDVGVPVVHSDVLSGRPFLSVSITPAFGSGRQRDGRGVLGGL